MTKLNDTQRVLLSTAAQRDSGSFYPLLDTLDVARAAKAMAGLVKSGFAEERETNDPTSVHRSDGDPRFGMFITEAGIPAIDAGPDEAGGEAPSLPVTNVERISKSAAVVALLKRDGGATLPELIEATGWLPHTTRAALTGLRKNGHAIERGKRDDATCYTIPAVA